MALCPELPDCPGQIRIPLEFSVGVLGVRESGEEGFLAGAAQNVARRAERPGAAREETLDELSRLSFEGRGGDGARGESCRCGFGARIASAGQDPFGGSCLAHPRGQERGRRRRETSESDLRKTDARVLGGKHDVAGGGNLGASPEARPGDGGDRYGRCLDEDRQRSAHGREHPLHRPGLGNMLGDLDARREGSGQPRENEHANVPGLLHGPRKLIQIRGREDVDGRQMNVEPREVASLRLQPNEPLSAQL